MLCGGIFFFSCSGDGNRDNASQVPIKQTPVASPHSLSTAENHPHLPASITNHAPVASASVVTTVAGVTIFETLQASDLDGDALIYRIVAEPQLGKVRLDPASGTFSYMPNVAGLDSFTFRASDGRLDSNVAVVTLTVRPPLAWESLRITDLQADIRQLQDLVDLFEPTDGRVAPADAATLRQPLPFPQATIVAVDPFNPDHSLVYAGEAGLQVSQNGSMTWSAVATGLAADDEITVIAFSAFTPSLIYLTTSQPQAGSRLLGSSDGGNTWRLLGACSTNPVLELVAGPLRNDGSVRLYARGRSTRTLYRAIDMPYQP
jgi:hypothetical protein